eukprot:Seg4081.7 transcript_id=Seg4081.7/GoldUCD/mRNA.D3Y31 product="hypothetical protein" protein_id=Seg4081.7/GoldUCD/D3Y31
MPLVDIEKLNSLLLRGGSKRKSNSDSNSSSSSLTFKDLKACHIENNERSDGGRNLYEHLKGRGHKKRKKDDLDDHDTDALTTQESHARLFDYYNLYKKYEKRRLESELRIHNPICHVSDNDYYNIKTYVDDYNSGLLRGGGEIYDLRLKIPFSALLIGKSKSGKTTLLLDILDQWRSYTSDSDGLYEPRIFWFYGTENAKDFHAVNEIIKNNMKLYKSHGEKTTNPRIEFIKGNFKDTQVIEKIKAMPEKSIVILDDLMTEMVQSADIANVLTRESHHRQWCVFLLWQDQYPQQQFARTIANQVDYKFIFRDPSRRDRIMSMCKQMFPGNAREMSSKINDYFDETPSTDYPYIRINLRPDSPKAIFIVANDLVRDKEHARLGLPKKPTKLFTFH